MPPSIRQEQHQDSEAVYNINKQAFAQEAEAKLVDSLRNSDAFVPELSLVAELDNQIVGHILFTKIKIVNNATSYESLALAPMAVLEDYQKQGIGGALIREGFTTSKGIGFHFCYCLRSRKLLPKIWFPTCSKMEY
jgi:putative acetyltransferase